MLSSSEPEKDSEMFRRTLRKFTGKSGSGSASGTGTSGGLGHVGTSEPSPLNFRNRSHLTEMLWKERYAKGLVGSTFSPTPSQKHAAVPGKNYEPRPKHMHESYCAITLPFRTDIPLREDYINYYKGLRFGRILEDLDAVAASIAYRHCQDDNSTIEDLPLTIVTASADRIEILNHLRPDLDLKLSGHVTYVGKSSMEVTIKVESHGVPDLATPIDQSGVPLDPETEWTPICLCNFTMVARDPKTGSAAQVNPLIVETEAERALFDLGHRRKMEKLEVTKQDMWHEAPTSDERLLIHKLWLESTKYQDEKGRLVRTKVPPNVSFPSETVQSTMKIMHPQERNIHSSIFGGYLMCEAMELAYTSAMLYIGGRPYTLALDDIAFKKPVPIGSILFMTSEIVYAEGEPHRTFQVKVTAEVSKESNLLEKNVTNVFYFTFASASTDLPVDRLLPVTYGEAMEYVMGKRRKERGIESKRIQLEEFKRLALITLK